MPIPQGEYVLTWKQKLAYGTGDLSISLVVTIVGAYFAIFLTDTVGLSAGHAALAVFIGRTWDYINDPLIGYLSDRTRSRWGRRRPFLLFGAIPFGLAFALMWWKPPIAADLGLVIYYATAYLVFDAAVTVVYMPYVSLTPELTQSYDERTGLTSYRMAFSILASLIAFVVPALLIGEFSPESARRFTIMGVVFGGVSIFPILVTFAGTRERAAYTEQSRPPLWASLRAAFQNRPFVFSAIMFLLTWISIDILQATLLFFIKYGLGRESQSEIIMASVFVTALIALPVWLAVSNRFDKRRAFVIGLSFWAVIQVGLILLTPAAGLPLVLALCVLAGIGVSAAHVLPWSIIPDAIEWDEWNTGTRHEGTFYSIVTLAQKIASSVAVPVALLVLEARGYVSGDETQPVAAIRAIRVLVGPVPAVLLLAAIAFALFYPLDRTEHRRIVADLELRRSRLR